MKDRPAQWFRSIAVMSMLLAVLMVPAIEWLQHVRLSLWFHLPLMGVVLGLISLGAVIAGVAYLEYQARSTK